ncbi:transporter substrate-binding domain-containing protein [Vibrio sp. VB16]|uniref:transporter substrate-binding domain-containing protein n=1 Tax=Vibrio sp. VB16 TaxID=2785746 RepID=UPI0018A0D281|nr:transporter substrate-binding domain-containing protein [Vibrio sp. VB16]UGA57487.1 transporter substrate-binding domain-containing protein [Vibrio sp. VB16]
MDKCNQKRTLHYQLRLQLSVVGRLILIFFSSILFAHTSHESSPVTINSKLTLTANEQAWLAEHPIITMGGGIFPPLNFIDDDGESVGLAPDYLDLVAQRLGIKIDMVSGSWTEMQWLAKEHKVDGISILLKNTERKEYLDFVGPYSQLQSAILVNKDIQNITTLDDLFNKRVGIMAGAYSENFLKENHPDIELVLYKTYDEAVNALLNREIKAVVGGLPTLTYAIDKQLITGLKVAGLPETMAAGLYTGVRKDWPQFTVLLSKALASISEEEHQKIRSRWTELFPMADRVPRLALTMKQREWLEKKHKVQVMVVDLPPYMIVKAGKPPEGLAIDYLNIIAQRTGIEFNYEVSEQPFSDFLEGMKRGEGPDMIPVIVNRRERQEYMLFSDNYIESSTVIATRNKSVFITDVQSLTGKSVAVLKAGNVQKLLLENYPDIRLALYDSNEMALEALANGHIDAFVGSLTNTAYIIQKRGFSNIKIIATSSLGTEYFSMGNRKDGPELNSLINLALSSINERERTAIRSKYVTLKYEVRGIAYAELLIWIISILCIALLIVLGFITWNSSLRRLVNSRTVDLQQEIAEREQVNNALLKSQKESLKAQNIARLGYWEWDLSNDILTWSEEIYRIFGFSSDTELTYQKIMLSVHPDDHQAIEENNAKWLRSHQGGMYEYRVIKVDGSLCNVHAIAEVVCNAKGEVSRLFGTMQDVSERKEIEHKLISYQQRLKSLALQLALVEGQERRRIAADLHDNVGQSLALTRLQLAAVLKHLPDKEKAAELIRSSSQSLLTAIQETRHLIFEISSPSLNELGLAAAITEWKDQACEKKHGLKVEVIDRLQQDRMGLDLRAILFRNVRELLVNVIKHAEATAVVVTIEEKAGSYIITVEDDGIGFMKEQLPENVSSNGHFGLFSIQERMIDLGGELLVSSELRKGCTVVMKLPTTEMDSVSYE